jgi:hypothetical protein
MLIVVLAIAVVGMVVLAAAIITGKTIIALVVIALALVGLVLLTRDWLSDRSRPDADPAGDGDERAAPEIVDAGAGDLAPDRFEPDIADEQADVSEAADPAVDGNDSTGDIGAGPARQKH